MKIHNTIKTKMRKCHKILSITLASLLLASSFPANGGTSLAKSTSAMPAAAAGSDFVYVFRTQQSFGDFDTGGTFRGDDETFNFTLPSNLAPGTAHVMVHAAGLSNNCNIFAINGSNLGIFVARSNPNEFFVEMGDIPSGILHPGTNMLTIKALNQLDCTDGGDRDEFRLSNAVVFYHVQ